MAPILYDYHPEWRKQIETDASDLAKARILSQYEPDERWHPFAFYNKCFLPTELNYDVHDKEMVVPYITGHCIITGKCISPHAAPVSSFLAA